MKYRSQYMRSETPPNKIRNLDKASLEATVAQCRYVKDLFAVLDIPYQQYYKDLFIAQCARHEVDIIHLVPNAKQEDLTGRVFGRLKVLRKGPITKSGMSTWYCEEVETGIVKQVFSKHLRSGATKSFSFWFKTGEEHVQWTGHGQISGQYWSTVRRHALTRKMTLDIGIDRAWSIYLEQGRRCALSGIPISFGEGGCSLGTASFDRIDSAKGYVEGNVQWVHKRVNIMKNRFDETEFIDFCRAVAATNPLPIK